MVVFGVEIDDVCARAEDWDITSNNWWATEAVQGFDQRLSISLLRWRGPSIVLLLEIVGAVEKGRAVRAQSLGSEVASSWG